MNNKNIIKTNITHIEIRASKDENACWPYDVISVSRNGRFFTEETIMNEASWVAGTCTPDSDWVQRYISLGEVVECIDRWNSENH